MARSTTTAGLVHTACVSRALLVFCLHPLPQALTRRDAFANFFSAALRLSDPNAPQTVKNVTSLNPASLARGRAVVPVASLPTRKEYLQQAYKVFLLVVVLYYVLTLAYVGYVEGDFALELVLASLLFVCCMASIRLGSFIRSSGYLNELTASTIHNGDSECEQDVQTRFYQAVLISMLMGFAGSLADLQKSTLFSMTIFSSSDAYFITSWFSSPFFSGNLASRS